MPAANASLAASVSKPTTSTAMLAACTLAGVMLTAATSSREIPKIIDLFILLIVFLVFNLLQLLQKCKNEVQM
jgi:hypothetical protein